MTVQWKKLRANSFVGNLDYAYNAPDKDDFFDCSNVIIDETIRIAPPVSDFTSVPSEMASSTFVPSKMIKTSMAVYLFAVQYDTVADATYLRLYKVYGSNQLELVKTIATDDPEEIYSAFVFNQNLYVTTDTKVFYASLSSLTGSWTSSSTVITSAVVYDNKVYCIISNVLKYTSDFSTYTTYYTITAAFGFSKLFLFKRDVYVYDFYGFVYRLENKILRQLASFGGVVVPCVFNKILYFFVTEGKRLTIYKTTDGENIDFLFYYEGSSDTFDFVLSDYLELRGWLYLLMHDGQILRMKNDKLMKFKAITQVDGAIVSALSVWNNNLLLVWYIYDTDYAAYDKINRLDLALADTSGYYETSHLFSEKSKEMILKEIFLEHAKLPANTTIKLYTSIDEGTSTLQATNTTDDTIKTEKIFSSQKMNRIKIKVVLESTSSSYNPELISINILADAYGFQ